MVANKISNDYAAEIAHYERMPKAVLAAIAVSFTSCGGDNMDGVTDRLIDEWWALHQAGIVPQKPPVPRPSLELESESDG